MFRRKGHILPLRVGCLRPRAPGGSPSRFALPLRPAALTELAPTDMELLGIVALLLALLLGLLALFTRPSAADRPGTVGKQQKAKKKKTGKKVGGALERATRKGSPERVAPPWPGRSFQQPNRFRFDSNSLQDSPAAFAVQPKRLLPASSSF